MILAESPLKSRVKLFCYTLLKNSIYVFLPVPFVSSLTPSARVRRRHQSALDEPVGPGGPPVSVPGRLLLSGLWRRVADRRRRKTLPNPFHLLAVFRYRHTLNWTGAPNTPNGSRSLSENEYELYKNNDIRPPFTYATLIRQVEPLLDFPFLNVFGLSLR